MQAAAIEQVRKSFNKLIRCVRGLEWPDPSVPADIKAYVSRFDHAPSGKCRATNYIFHVLGKNLFVANPILHGAYRAARAKNMLCLLDRRTCVRTFRSDNSKITNRDLRRILSSVQARRKVFSPANAQTAFVDGTDVLLGYVISVHFDVRQSREMRPKDAANRPAADDADFHAHAGSKAASPASSAASKSGRERNGQ